MKKLIAEYKSRVSDYDTLIIICQKEKTRLRGLLRSAKNEISYNTIKEEVEENNSELKKNQALRGRMFQVVVDLECLEVEE